MSGADFFALVRRLSDHGVDFLIVGGMAVNFHGYIRAKDLDISPAPGRENLQRLIVALRDLEAEVDGTGDFKPDELPDPIDLELLEGGGNWLLRTRLGRLDILQCLGDSNVWERFAASAESVDLGGTPVKVISYDDLVAMKKEADRPSDRVDLEKLEQARAEGE